MKAIDGRVSGRGGETGGKVEEGVKEGRGWGKGRQNNSHASQKKFMTKHDIKYGVLNGGDSKNAQILPSPNRKKIQFSKNPLRRKTDSFNAMF